MDDLLTFSATLPAEGPPPQQPSNPSQGLPPPPALADLDPECHQALTDMNADRPYRFNYFSQEGQDFWYYRNIARHMPHRGVYLDVATNHYKEISNTYFLDKCLGWNGICVEANPAYHDGIRTFRSCTLIDTCVAEKEMDVTFVLAGGLGGIEQFEKNDFVHGAHHEQRINLTCVVLKNVLEKQGVTHIDYMSLDVEGGEMSVLKGIDFDKVTIDVLMVERGRTTEVPDFLKSKGYTELMGFSEDIFFVRKGFFVPLTQDALVLRRDHMNGVRDTCVMFKPQALSPTHVCRKREQVMNTKMAEVLSHAN